MLPQKRLLQNAVMVMAENVKIRKMMYDAIMASGHMVGVITVSPARAACQAFLDAIVTMFMGNVPANMMSRLIMKSSRL